LSSNDAPRSEAATEDASSKSSSMEGTSSPLQQRS
jgi:hypothetical protein